MAKTKISEWSTTPSSNADIDGINIAEGCAPSGINDAIRDMMAQIRSWQSGATGDPFAGPVTGAVNATVGATTPASGAFTTLSASGAVTLSGGTANGVAYLNGSKVVTTGSALVFDGSQFKTSVSGNTPIVNETTGGTSNYLQLKNTGGSAYIGSVSNDLAFYYSGSATEQMRLTSTGLGIGTSSPSAKLDVSSSASRILNLNSTSANGYGMAFANSGTDVGYIGSAKWNFGGALNDMSITTHGAYNLCFGTNDTERARITAAGELLLTGLTSPISSGILCIATNLNNNNPIVAKNTTTQGAGQTFIVFTNSSNSIAGAIQHTGTTSVTYSTSSDARLKTDLGVAVSTDVIDNTIIHDYEWKEDKKIDRGVFAQEAFEVKPTAVAVGNDELTEDGNLARPWGVDYSKYVPDLIVHAQQLKKQVQEQQAIIESLKARLDAANL